MTDLHITVHGTPAPQGSKRHVGGGRLIESSAKVKPWREAVKHAALDLRHDGDLPLAACTCGAAHTILESCLLPGQGVLKTRWQVALEGPLSVDIVFTLPKPASAPKRRVTWPAKKPDLDKLVRAVFDALTDAGVWRDDSQVVGLHATKCYPLEGVDALPHPGAVITVQALAQENPA